MPDTILLQVSYQEWIRFHTVTVGVKQCCTSPELPDLLLLMESFMIDTILYMYMQPLCQYLSLVRLITVTILQWLKKLSFTISFTCLANLVSIYVGILIFFCH